MSEEVHFRPHARLLTMLGEQLIKSDQIALVELVKNSYDADASRVWVDFRDFGPNFEVGPASSIQITDDGSGMNAATLRDAWMSPATPSKLRRKRRDAFTVKGRALQGEKGIGRFAAFKLGSRLSLETRLDNAPREAILRLDISVLDEDHPGAVQSDKASNEAEAAAAEVFLDEIPATLDARAPEVFVVEPPGYHGTRIRVGKVRSNWSRAKVESAYADLERLQPVMWDQSVAPLGQEDFKVHFLKDGLDLLLHGGRGDHFQATLEHAVLKVTNGRLDTEGRRVDFNLNDRPISLPLDGSEVRGLRPFKERFLKDDPEAIPRIACGSFGFSFYVFDFSNLAPAAYQLDKDDKEMLRAHRIYLYRDGVRVYPYGDPDDDWLQIDVIRGTQSARSMFSNDQAVGYVAITQAENPDLRDKTNREGLLEAGAATGDFIALVQTVLSYLRSKPYEQYAAANRRARERSRPRTEAVNEQFRRLREGALTLDAKRAVDSIQAAVTTEREVAQTQIARTQDLAGVGLSVESASHDLIAASAEALRTARLVQTELRQLGLVKEYVYTLSTSLVQRLEFVDSRFQDVQGLFVSTRQKRGPVDIMQQARKVRSMYSALHRAKKIDFEIDDASSGKAMTTEAAVLQTLINLVDNASYWLQTQPDPPRIIRLFAASAGSYVVTDNGPGIPVPDRDYIFEPFYSGKGDAGKGLGLYIAREVSTRNGFTVELDEIDDVRVLPGATFVLRFAEAVA